MLLTLFAIVVGSVIGHLRGGDKSGASQAQLKATPLLVIAIATVLVQAVLNPVFPFAWSFVSLTSFIAFGALNRHLTGMRIMLVGAVLNLLPMLLNGATPVSELALISVDDLTPFGEPDIDGARESSQTATRLRFLGDAIPVPIFGAVVSIGDLIALVGLADIFTNLFLRERRREMSLEDAGVSFGTPPARDKVRILSPLQIAGRTASGFAHRRPRLKEAPASHVPAHAAPELDEPIELTETIPAPAHSLEPVVLEHFDTDLEHFDIDAVQIGDIEIEDVEIEDVEIEDAEIDLRVEEPPPRQIEDEPTVELEVIVAPAPEPLVDEPMSGSTDADADPILLAGIKAVPVTPAADEPAVPTPVYEEVVEVIDLTDPNDPRPIIDLTSSPTDEQMTEFLRRRRAADRDLQRVAVRPAGPRRGRAPVRIRTDANGGVVESSR